MSTNTITERVGSRYAETADADITDIAKMIRADLKNAKIPGIVEFETVPKFKDGTECEGQLYGRRTP